MDYLILRTLNLADEVVVAAGAVVVTGAAVTLAVVLLWLNPDAVVEATEVTVYVEVAVVVTVAVSVWV